MDTFTAPRDHRKGKHRPRQLRYGRRDPRPLSLLLGRLLRLVHRDSQVAAETTAGGRCCAHPLGPSVGDHPSPSAPHHSLHYRGDMAAVAHSGDTICLAPYPQADPAFLDAQACAGMERIKEVVRALRNLRAQFSVPASARVEGAIVPSDETLRPLLEPALPIIQALARLSRLSLGEASSGQQDREGKWVAEALAGLRVLLCLGDEVDSTKELERIDKELEAVAKQIARSEGLLNNPQFVERAKPEIVEKERATLAEWQAKREALERRKQQLLSS